MGGAGRGPRRRGALPEQAHSRTWASRELRVRSLVKGPRTLTAAGLAVIQTSVLRASPVLTGVSNREVGVPRADSLPLHGAR